MQALLLEFKKYYNHQVQLERSLSVALQHIDLGLKESTAEEEATSSAEASTPVYLQQVNNSVLGCHQSL